MRFAEIMSLTSRFFDVPMVSRSLKNLLIMSVPNVSILGPFGGFEPRVAAAQLMPARRSEGSLGRAGLPPGSAGKFWMPGS